MSRYIRWAVGSGALWTAGDFFAQFYSAHKEAAARRARGEKSSGQRPSGKQMFAMLDQERLGQAAAFGALAGPVCLQYGLLLPRVFGSLAGAAAPSLCALAVQQMFATPCLLLAYFNGMTALRGGFSDPSFLAAHSSGPTGRLDVWSVQKHVFEEVLPQPLLASWAVATPMYLLAYCAPVRGATAVVSLLALPWCASVAYTQSDLLL